MRFTYQNTINLLTDSVYMHVFVIFSVCLCLCSAGVFGAPDEVKSVSVSVSVMKGQYVTLYMNHTNIWRYAEDSPMAARRINSGSDTRSLNLTIVNITTNNNGLDLNICRNTTTKQVFSVREYLKLQ